MYGDCRKYPKSMYYCKGTQREVIHRLNEDLNKSVIKRQWCLLSSSLPSLHEYWAICLFVVIDGVIMQLYPKRRINNLCANQTGYY